jgi:O-antigen ligase
LISVGVLLSFFAMYQFATHSTKVWGETRPEQYWQRGGGTFFNPNNLAGYLQMLVPLALSYVVLGRLSATVKVVLAYAALAMLGGILATVSRGGIVAAGVALILLCVILVMQGKFWLPAIAVVCFLIVLAFGVSNQFETVQKRFAMAVQNDKIGDSRTLYWQSARQLFARDMLWGIGPGHFDVEFPQVRPPPVQTRPQYVHNDYLNTLCEWGVTGAAIVTAALVLLYAGAFRALRAVRKDHNDLHSKPSDRAAFVLGASVGLAGLLFHCIFEFNMQIPADALAAVTLMALLTAQWRFVTDRYWMNPGFYGRIVLTVMAVMAASYLAAAGIHRGVESFWLWRASTERVSWERLLANLKKAHEADPSNPDTDIHLGETCWEMSLTGDRGYEDKAKEAIKWFGKAMEINPFDSAPPVCIGLCMDWIGQCQQATAYFELAMKKDPNSAYIAAEMGRHCVALRDYSAAKHWFNHSMELEWSPFAADELMLLESRLADPLTAPGK